MSWPFILNKMLEFKELFLVEYPKNSRGFESFCPHPTRWLHLSLYIPNIGVKFCYEILSKPQLQKQISQLRIKREKKKETWPLVSIFFFFVWRITSLMFNFIGHMQLWKLEINQNILRKDHSRIYWNGRTNFIGVIYKRDQNLIRDQLSKQVGRM